MITRAQAEALLTLAESLEACERLGMTVETSDLVTDVGITFEDRKILRARGPMLSSMDVRLIVNKLVPKAEIVADTMTLSCPAWDSGMSIVIPRSET